MAESNLEAALLALAQSGADFVVIGGLALLLHGGNYLTFDLDVAYHRTKANAQMLVSALESKHPLPAGLPEGLPFVWDTETLLRSSILTLDTDLGRIDSSLCHQRATLRRTKS